MAVEKEARFVAKWLVMDPSTFDGDDSVPAEVMSRAREIIRERELEKERIRKHPDHGKVLRAIEATLGASSYAVSRIHAEFAGGS